MSAPDPNPTRVSLWEWAQTVLLGLTLAWSTLCLGGYPPRIAVVSTVLTALLVAVHFTARALARSGNHSHHVAGWWLIPFVLYAAASVLWVTPVPWLGWLEWLGWAQMIAVFWVVVNGIRSAAPRRVLFFLLIALALVGVVAGAYQRFVQPEWAMAGWGRGREFWQRASGTFAIPNSFAGYLILLLPVVGALVFRRGFSATQRIWWGWVTVVLTFGLLLTISRGAFFALGLALVAWPLVGGQGRWLRRVASALGMAAILVVVGATIYAQSPKVRQRFSQLVLDSGEKTRPVMWRGAWQLFRSEPVFGTGAASYNVLFERHRPEGFRDEPRWAHNEFLNTLSDYGATGFVLFFGGCLAVAAIGSSRSHRGPAVSPGDWLDAQETRTALAIGLLAFALQLTVDFHLKIPALAMTAATVAGLWIGRTPSTMAGNGRHLSSRGARAACLGVAAGWPVVVALFFVPKLRSEAARIQGRHGIDRLAQAGVDSDDFRKTLPSLHSALRRATAWDARNGQAWSDLSYATALRVYTDPTRGIALGKEAEDAANRAIACSAVCSEFWIRRGIARNMQGRWAEAGSDFSRAVAVAPADAMTWYYFADHLSRRPQGLDAAIGAVAFCLRLDPLNSAGVALRQRLAIKSKAP